VEAAVPDKLYFRIGEVSEIVGVKEHVLRYWESEFELQPRRSTAGQRLYQQEDIARFLRLRKLLHDQGFTIAGARKAIRADAASGKKKTVGVEARALAEALDRVRRLRASLAALGRDFGEDSTLDR
jgi:DNA-binding transcriptional MerR regulator